VALEAMKEEKTIHQIAKEFITKITKTPKPNK
jgi:hypothetical protein